MRLKNLAVVALAFVVMSCSSAPGPESAPAPPPIDQAKFEAVYRSAKSMAAATQVGITYVDFGKQLQAFATELAIAKDKASTAPETELVGRFQSVLDAYVDSHTLWKEKLDTDDEIWKGQIIHTLKGTSNPDIVRIAETYALPKQQNTGEISGKWIGIPGDSMQVVWTEAERRSREATDLYLGTKQTPK